MGGIRSCGPSRMRRARGFASSTTGMRSPCAAGLRPISPEGTMRRRFETIPYRFTVKGEIHVGGGEAIYPSHYRLTDRGLEVLAGDGTEGVAYPLLLDEAKRRRLGATLPIIHAFKRSPLDHEPFLPGSAVKGALRTVTAYHLLRGDAGYRRRLERRLLAARRGREVGGVFERVLFQGNEGTSRFDRFRAFSFSEARIRGEGVLALRLLSSEEGMEIVSAEHRFEGRLRLERGLFTRRETRAAMSWSEVVDVGDFSNFQRRLADAAQRMIEETLLPILPAEEGTLLSRVLAKRGEAIPLFIGRGGGWMHHAFPPLLTDGVQAHLRRLGVISGKGPVVPRALLGFGLLAFDRAQGGA
ncbi:MAG: hypothetical protein D6812_06310 [Deltaproteobacteria bacterium]|nr:MAG: hypothetical protein D6812_06310 [Deltaproteobacteria bacterium]